MHKWFTRHRSIVSSFLLLLLNSSESVSRKGEKWDARSGGNSPLRGSISLGTSVMKVFANRYQSMKFFCDYRLADTNRYQLTNFIDWYRYIDCISDYRFHRLVTPGLISVLFWINNRTIKALTYYMYLRDRLIFFWRDFQKKKTFPSRKNGERGAMSKKNIKHVASKKSCTTWRWRKNILPRKIK